MKDTEIKDISRKVHISNYFFIEIIKTDDLNLVKNY
jgi:hypothetical protein